MQDPNMKKISGTHAPGPPYNCVVTTVKHVSTSNEVCFDIVISFPFLIRTPWNHECWNQSLLCLMIFCRYITNILSVHLLQFYSGPPTFKCLATLLIVRQIGKLRDTDRTSARNLCYKFLYIMFMKITFSISFTLNNPLASYLFWTLFFYMV